MNKLIGEWKEWKNEGWMDNKNEWQNARAERWGMKAENAWMGRQMERMKGEQINVNRK